MAFGSVLSEEVDSSANRKARGAFFTPPALSDYLCKFAIADKSDRVLEPSCGEAGFLISAAKRLRELGASDNELDGALVGCELHEDSANAARSRLSSLGVNSAIRVGDFFDVEPVQSFSAVIGNPPYIRYQEFTGAQRQKAKESALALGVTIDSLASSWAPFVVHAARFLKRGGRMALVLPAELLSTNYAAPIRRFFLREFADVRVILFEASVFPEVQEEVVLLLASGFAYGGNDSISLMQLKSVDELGKEDFQRATVEDGARWPNGVAARDASKLLAPFVGLGLVPLSFYGDVRLGAVTGSNRYFTLSDSEKSDLGLEEDDVTALCPPGSRHLRRLSLDESDFEDLRKSGSKVWLFSPSTEPSPAAKRYIEHGETLGLDQKYKCRIRSPWWKVPGVRSCDLFLTYMNGAGPNLCVNSAGLAYLNSVHGITIDASVDRAVKELLPLAAMSTPSLLSAELVGRSYGGGILKLEPREATNWLMPSQEVLLDSVPDLEAVRDSVSDALNAGDRDAATLLVDGAFAGHMGLDSTSLQRLRGLLLEMRGRRAKRAQK